MPKLSENKPTLATAEHGEIMLDGPDGIAASLTPDAASKSARNIDRAVADAAQQAQAAEQSLPDGGTR